MDEVLDTPFYQDDILSRTLTTSVLYDKSTLEFNFQTDCHNGNVKPDQDENAALVHQNQNGAESPNLDFLKLGSPDLEKMFMNFQGSEASSPCQDQSSDFSLNAADSLCPTENSFTNALQQLHDQQDVPDQSTVIDHFQGNQETFSLVDDRHLSTSSPNHGNEGPSHPVHRRTQIIRRHEEPEGGFMNSSNNIVNNAVCTNMHVASDGTILACPPPSVPQRTVPPTIPLGIQGPNSQDPMVLHNFNIVNNNANNLQPQIIRQLEPPAFYGHNMGNFQDRENLPSMYEFAMHENNNQNAHMRGMPQKFHENSFVETGFAEQMPLPAIENLSGLTIEDQAKLYVDNPHMQPINLEIQELVKRERKKLRNRIASSKCRKRKLEREARLEDRVKDLKEKNIELNAVSNALKQQVCDLKQRVMDHVSEGCQIVLPAS